MTEILLYGLVVFTPWAFGTTQGWSIWTANAMGLALGLVFVAKRVVRWQGEEEPAGGSPGGTRFTAILAGITMALLAYVAMSALNARADYDEIAREFRYFDRYVRWLPHSYDRDATWSAFWQYLALAAVFWSVRDWLLAGEKGDSRGSSGARWDEVSALSGVPSRIRRLFWVLCLQAAVLGMVCIVQRADGTNRLLWILESRSNKPADNVFGPWSYRANAAQYFNLVWPLCLAFWIWSQERAGRVKIQGASRFDGPQLILLPCAVLLAACPVISASRGGALVAVILGLIAIVAIALVSRRSVSPSVRRLTLATLVVAGLAGLGGGWTTLRERLYRPDPRFTSGLQVGTGEFTLLVRLRWLGGSAEPWQPVLSLGGASRSAVLPHSLVIGRVASGGITAVLVGDARTNTRHVTTLQPVPGGPERETVLALVRRADGMRIFADGVELPVREGEEGRGPGWSGFVHSRFVFPQDPTITEVGLARFAMAPDELTAASGAADWSALGGEVQAELAVPNEGDPSGVFGISEGAVAESTTRRTDAATRWLALRRASDAGSGALGLHWTLAGIDARLRGMLRVGFTVWNPGTTPVRIAVAFDGGLPEMVEVAARSERTATVAVRAPHGETPRVLSWTLVDEDGFSLDEVAAGTQVMFRGVAIRLDEAMYAKRLAREVSLGNLGDRMSGRAEVYANSRRMVSDYPVWGSGAGTFASLYQLYLQPGQEWFAYLHNDWGETRITLGLVGLVMVVTGWVVLGLRSWWGTGVPTPRLVLVLLWLGPLGCLAHARFDFPFQVYSVFCLFVVITAVLSVLTATRPR